MRIAVEIQRILDLEASRVTHRRLFLHRLWVRIRFRYAAGWSEPHVALLDTGAPYSLIPLSLQPALQVERYMKRPVRGIAPGKTAEVGAVLARVSGQLLDARRTSHSFPLWAMLADENTLPLILGWSGCLDRAKLVVNARRRVAWLEF